MSTLLPTITYYCLLYVYSMPSASRVPWSAKTAARRGPSPMLSHDSAVPPYPMLWFRAQPQISVRHSALQPTIYHPPAKERPITVIYITSITHIKYWTTLQVASLVTQSAAVSLHCISPQSTHSLPPSLAGARPLTGGMVQVVFGCPTTSERPGQRQSRCASPCWLQVD